MKTIDDVLAQLPPSSTPEEVLERLSVEFPDLNFEVIATEPDPTNPRGFSLKVSMVPKPPHKA